MGFQEKAIDCPCPCNEEISLIVSANCSCWWVAERKKWQLVSDFLVMCRISPQRSVQLVKVLLWRWHSYTALNKLLNCYQQKSDSNMIELLISKCHLGEVAQISYVQAKPMLMVVCGQGCWASVYFHDDRGNQWVLTTFELSYLYNSPVFSVLTPSQSGGISLKIHRLYPLSADLISLPEKQNRLAVLSQRHMLIELGDGFIPHSCILRAGFKGLEQPQNHSHLLQQSWAKALSFETVCLRM